MHAQRSFLRDCGSQHPCDISGYVTVPLFFALDDGLGVAPRGTLAAAIGASNVSLGTTDIGLYFGRIEPGAEIAREIHPATSETVYILAGRAVGLCGEAEVPLEPGQVLHVDKNVPHGLRNAGATTLEFLVIGHPDF